MNAGNREQGTEKRLLRAAEVNSNERRAVLMNLEVDGNRIAPERYGDVVERY